MPTVLVVDDEDDVRSLVQTMLADTGYEGVATGDPMQAVSLARRCRPALIVCDIAMPGMDGYDVVRALQTDPETAACPVAFLTARRQFTERVKAWRSAAPGGCRNRWTASSTSSGSSTERSSSGAKRWRWPI